MNCGLIGHPLKHSYSCQIHRALASYDYRLWDLTPEELAPFLERREFAGINVTIPYKQQVIPYLDGLSHRARAIGAVNTIVNRDGRLLGYNTDFAGMAALLRRLGIELSGKKVLVLGTGGTSRTACAVADLRVAVLHGRMKPKEKEKVMAAFAAGESYILVSTTVVEVGVDVPNATLMVVENADRFGLSQLHQLRGRVGRGKAKSWCVLLSDVQNEDTRRRLKALTETNDGFRIAEEDLKLRGPGDFFGSRQHGLPVLKAADLSCDMPLLAEARSAAQALLCDDPQLSDGAHAPLRRRIHALFQLKDGTLN